MHGPQSHATIRIRTWTHPSVRRARVTPGKMLLTPSEEPKARVAAELAQAEAERGLAREVEARREAERLRRQLGPQTEAGG